MISDVIRRAQFNFYKSGTNFRSSVDHWNFVNSDCEIGKWCFSNSNPTFYKEVLFFGNQIVSCHIKCTLSKSGY
jgi:hypothetical protein